MKRGMQVLFPLLLAFLVFSFGSRRVHAESRNQATVIQLKQESLNGAEIEEKDTETETVTVAETDGILTEQILDEFDFNELNDKVQELLPEEKLTFQELLTQFLSGETEGLQSMAVRFLQDHLAYEWNTGKRSLISMLVIALLAAVFSNFAGVFQNRQASEISFYILYMLLLTLCMSSFKTILQGAEQQVEHLVDFMEVLCPSYFLAVSFATGSATAVAFYQILLFIVYLVELVILKFLFPIVNLFLMMRVLSNLTGEEALSEFSELLQKLVSWALKTLIACVIGMNTLQGLLAPAIDSLKRSAVTRTAGAIPWIGDVAGGTAELVLGTASLIKNGIGVAGTVIVIAVCAGPILQVLILSFLYKLAGALVQPVSDKRITACISGVSTGYELLTQVLFSTALLFLITLAVVAGK